MVKFLAVSLTSGDELRAVGRVLVENPHGRYHVRLDARSDMHLDPGVHFRRVTPYLWSNHRSNCWLKSRWSRWRTSFRPPAAAGALADQALEDRREGRVLEELRHFQAGDRRGQPAAFVGLAQGRKRSAGS